MSGADEASTREHPCPQCGRSASGSFCQHCGASLGGRFCNECGARLGQGANFCNQCGTSVAGGAGDPPPQVAARTTGRTTARTTGRSGGARGGNAAWYVGGAFAVILILVVVWPTIAGREGSSGSNPGAAPSNPAAGPSSVDLASMSPREAADRLFDRVMRAASAGDSMQAQQFTPMALQAYERARPLDSDGLFHVSLLQRTGLQLEAALATAEQILSRNPDHLLGLAAAGDAARELGRSQVASEHYRRLLEVFDRERAKALPEYEIHEPMMDGIRSAAETHLAGG